MTAQGTVSRDCNRLVGCRQEASLPPLPGGYRLFECPYDVAAYVFGFLITTKPESTTVR
jgi:hypothetical protein